MRKPREAQVRVLTRSVYNPHYDQRQKHRPNALEKVEIGTRVLIVNANEWEPEATKPCPGFELIQRSSVPHIYTQPQFVADVIKNSVAVEPEGYAEHAQILEQGGERVAYGLLRELFKDLDLQPLILAALRADAGIEDDGVDA